MNWFDFKGVNSKDFKNIIVNELPPIVKPAEKIEQYEIDGRNGKLNVLTGVYETVVRSVQCTVKNLDGIDEIMSWLRGSGQVVFSNQADRYYMATVINQIPFERVIRHYRTFIIEFECQPFGYLWDDTIIDMETPTSVVNLGNVYSEPTITVYGSSAGSIYINDQKVEFKRVDGAVVIDSESLQCYKSSDYTPYGRHMVGDFPILGEGENQITWDGGITRLKIQPNWRCC